MNILVRLVYWVYIKCVTIVFDIAKNCRNITKHGVPLTAALGFRAVLVFEDDRFDYGETRMIAVGHIGGRAYLMAFTMRSAAIRVISLRKANPRERRNYGL